MPLAARGGLAEGGKRAKQKHSGDNEGPVHPKSPLLEDFLTSPRSGPLQSDDVSDPGPRAVKSEKNLLGPSSVAAHAPANHDEQIPIRVPQAPSEEITVSLLAATASFGYSLGEPLAQATPYFLPVLLPFLSVSPVADPLAEATP
jgi:hypothetical protein